MSLYKSSSRSGNSTAERVWKWEGKRRGKMVEMAENPREPENWQMDATATDDDEAAAAAVAAAASVAAWAWVRGKKVAMEKI